MGKISIIEYGPIEKAEIDLEKDVQLIIGSQASGKSTICKMVYFCQKVRDYVVDFAMQEEQFRNTHRDNRYANCMKFLVRKFIEFFGTTWHMRTFRLRYDISEERWLELSLKGTGFIRFKFSENLSSRITEILDVAEQWHMQLKIVDVAERIEYRQYMRRQISEKASIAFDNVSRLIYIPAGRSLLATSSGYFVNKEDLNMDLMMREFCSLIEETKARFGRKIPEMLKNYTQTVSGQINNMALEDAYHLIKKILKADYASENDGEKIYFDKNHYVKLQYASSGQHEALWILMLCYIIILENRKTFLVVEEPEAHLFPEAQQWIVELLALTANTADCKIMITTHSPYILTSLNVLLLSHAIEKQTTQNAVVKRNCRLASGRTAAYKLEDKSNDGYILSCIMDFESGLIEADYIDNVSRIINAAIDRLLEKEVDE